MTIGAASRVSLACDGTTKVFPVAIQAYAAIDLTVILTAPVSAGGGQGTLVLNSDYSLVASGTLSPAAWTLTTLAAAAYVTGYTLQVFANPVQTQQTQYVQGQPFPSFAVQTNFDRLTQMVQRIQDEVSRCIRAPDGDVAPAMVLPTSAARVTTGLLFDANGNVTLGIVPSTIFTQALFNSFFTGAPPYVQTATELAAGITPTNFNYAPGNVLRYGADPTGGVDSSVAWSNACKCNAEVYDGFPGGGVYLFTGSVSITNWPITIRGQTRWPISTGGLTGTKLILASAAGAGPHFSIPNQSYGINFRHLGFTWQSATATQQAIVANNDLRYSMIEQCSFVNTLAAVSGNNLIGIQLKNASIFTGDVVIRDNFFDALFQPIVLQGACTTVKVYGNEFYGHAGLNAVNSLGVITGGSGYTNGTYNNVPLTGGTGSGATAQIVVSGGAVTAVTLLFGGSNYTAADALSASTGNIGPGTLFAVPAATVGNLYGFGIQCAYPTTEPIISMNYFEGFNTGIYSNGAAYLKQIGNDYAANSNHWTWVKTSFAKIWNQSFGETFQGGGAGLINYPQNNVDLCQVLSGPGTYYLDNATMSAGLGYIEQQRAVANSHWQTRAFAAGNFTASGSMTWTVAGGNVSTETWEVDGQAVTYTLTLTGSTAGGTQSTQLKIALPFTPTNTVSGPCIVQNNNVFSSAGAWTVNAGVATLVLLVDATAATNWTLSANTGAKFSARFQIN